MESFNQWLFLQINASHPLTGAELTLVTIAAELPLILIPGCLLFIWFRNRGGKAVAYHACLTALLSLSCNFVISLVWYHNRPFADHLGQTLISHIEDSSFPSDHITLFASVGVFLCLDRTYRYLGGTLLLLSLVTGWARVFVGVHYPLDIAGAYLISAIMAFIYFRLLSRLFAPLLPLLIICEEKVLRLLNITKKSSG